MTEKTMSDRLDAKCYFWNSNQRSLKNAFFHLPVLHAPNTSCNSSSNAAMSTLYTNDTEGGLHLPLGSTSPIMRKLHPQHISPYSNQCPISNQTVVVNKIRPPPLELNLSGSSSNEHSIITPRPSSYRSQSFPLQKPSSSSHTHEAKFSLREIHAIQEWQKLCREKEIRLYEEVHQNILAVFMQRKKQSAVIGKKANSHNGCSKPSSIAAGDDITRQLDHATEMLELASQHRSWYQHNGKLVVFASLPHMSLQGVATHPMFTQKIVDKEEEIVTLSPGCVFHATEMIVLDSRTLRQVYPRIDSRGHDDIYVGKTNDEESSQQHNCAAATIQFLKITTPYIGYIVSHVHDYPYVAPGSVLDYVPDYKADSVRDITASTPATKQRPTSNQWLWRVIYQPDGAFVRNGSELNSDHIGTLSYGSFCAVKGKIINDMGLSRLRIKAYVKEDGFSVDQNKEETRAEKNEGEEREWKKISGWISLFINPLSGNGGKIIEPVNFPVPILYRVICENGAVIRSGVEISTTQIGLAPKGTVLSITGRSFSDHPKSCCIERLRLTGGRGWISARLNESSPRDRRIVELIGLDDSFDPDNPAVFHLKEQKKAMSEMTVNNDRATMFYQRQLSEINDDETSDQKQSSSTHERVRLKHSSLVSTPTLFQNGTFTDHPHPHANRCLICLSEERTATIVHGETGHIACCLTCARVLNARGDNCPVCRLPIDTVIQHFWA
ncbi:hypothetical protein HJC23_011102 [Cyclotella cryptica]|uniref:RING-type domain-containing protein n=1 Tax=Cyclotella cryptica TaxID=29204 RepID=A0ABD3P636_9STRA|eukprot:CCRYP_017309-RA/>CCRYP_017309-RA protein AED:0.03 eAED:0.03 QI:601/1/1/1/1/1/4/1469/722